MTRDEARQLRKGDHIVYLARSCESVGTVVEANYNCFTVHWHKAYWGDHFYTYGLYGHEESVRDIYKLNG